MLKTESIFEKHIFGVVCERLLYWLWVWLIHVHCLLHRAICIHICNFIILFRP